MCLIVFAWQMTPARGLVLAANRDEFHQRPAAPAAFWPDTPKLLAGRDLQAGGTWLGLTRDGRFAAITNVRDPTPERERKKPERSRGELTKEFLCGTQSPAEYLRELSDRIDAYDGFNLVVGDRESLWYLHGGAVDPAPPRALLPGIYGLSNAALDVPWPKVVLGRKHLMAVLKKSRPDSINHDELAACVSDRRLATRESLAQKGSGAARRGFGSDRENSEMARQLSAQFIITPQYGTRCTTTLKTEPGGVSRFRELRFNNHGDTIDSREYAL